MSTGGRGDVAIKRLSDRPTYVFFQSKQWGAERARHETANHHQASVRPDRYSESTDQRTNKIRYGAYPNV